MEQTTLIHIKGFHRKHTDNLDSYGVEIIENGEVQPVISLIRARGKDVTKSLEYVNHDVGIIYMATLVLRPEAQVSNEYLPT